MGMFVVLCSIVTLFVTVQNAVAMDTGSVQEPEMFLDQKMFVQLVRRVENLEKRDQDQQTEIDSLRGELNTEKVKTARLEGRLSRLQASLGVWLRTDEKVADTAIMTTDDVAMATDDVFETQSESHRADGGKADRQDKATVAAGDAIRPQSSRVRRQAETPVIAFHATLTKTATNVGVRQSIAFDRVVTNIGNAYNPHFGSFVAPVSGVYVFHTTVQVNSHHLTHASLVKNGVSVANMYIRGVETVGNNDSAMAVLRLSKGDDVAVQNNDGGINIDGYHYSRFSGFLLHLEDEGMSILG